MHGKFPTPRDITQDIMRMIRIQEVPMLMTIGFGLHLLAAPGVLALAAKHAFGPVPADYHAQIFERGGLTPPEPVLRVLRAIYLALAGMVAVVAVGIVALSGAAWSSGATASVLAARAAMALAAGGVSAPATWQVEWQAGVRIPWRPAVGLVTTVLPGIALML